MGDGVVVDLGQLPPSLPPPASPPAQPPYEADAPAEPESPSPAKDAPKPPAKTLSEESLSLLVGPAYADLYEVVSLFYVGERVPYGAEKMALRGKQLAVAFKELGWDEAKIVLIVGLVIGLGSDFANLYQVKQAKAGAPKKSGGA